jgi:hypothetical protein
LKECEKVKVREISVRGGGEVCSRVGLKKGLNVQIVEDAGGLELNVEISEGRG